jgi:hypothetical protein
MSEEQGDQIGQIFAYWAIVFSWAFIENYRSSLNFVTAIPLWYFVMC